MDREGNFVAEVCHIKAAMPDGERFDPSMTNEERRQLPNLVILCHEHHVVTNDVVKYSVARMEKLKADHEAIYSSVVLAIKKSAFNDLTKIKTPTPAISGARMNDVCEWNHRDTDLQATMESINRFFDRYEKVPESSLRLVAVVVDRGDYQWVSHSVSALADDIEEACQMPAAEVLRHLRILERHQVAIRDETDEGWVIKVGGPDWPMWEDLKRFAAKTGIDLADIIVHGKRELLD